jgi:DNA-binding response OmpR family regulator
VTRNAPSGGVSAPTTIGDVTSTNAAASTGATATPMKVLLYSDDRSTRDEVRLALGSRPDPDLPEVEIVEVATQAHVFRVLDTGTVDVAILDGESSPGGMGICRTLKDEIYNAPPVLVIIGRKQDGWLATWSRADAVVPHPIDPVAMARATADLMRQRAGVTQ